MNDWADESIELILGHKHDQPRSSGWCDLRRDHACIAVSRLSAVDPDGVGVVDEDGVLDAGAGQSGTSKVRWTDGGTTRQDARAEPRAGAGSGKGRLGGAVLASGQLEAII